MHLYADPGVVAIACPLYLPAPDAFPERRGTAIRHSLEIWRMSYRQRPRSCPNCLVFRHPVRAARGPTGPTEVIMKPVIVKPASILLGVAAFALFASRSEEHTSELQSLMPTSYAVFCLHKKNKHKQP